MLHLNYVTAPDWYELRAGDTRRGGPFGEHGDLRERVHGRCPQCGVPLVNDEPNRCLSCTWKRPLAERL